MTHGTSAVMPPAKYHQELGGIFSPGAFGGLVGGGGGGGGIRPGYNPQGEMIGVDTLIEPEIAAIDLIPGATKKPPGWYQGPGLVGTGEGGTSLVGTGQGGGYYTPPVVGEGGGGGTYTPPVVGTGFGTGQFAPGEWPPPSFARRHRYTIAVDPTSAVIGGAIVGVAALAVLLLTKKKRH